MTGRCLVAFRDNSQWKKVDLLCHHVLGTLSITKECGFPKQIDSDNGRIDHALEEEQEVGIVGRVVHEMRMQGV